MKTSDNDATKQTEPEAEKPSLTLLRGDRITAESLADLFEKLTGKRPTPEEIAQVKTERGEKMTHEVPAHHK